MHHSNATSYCSSCKLAHSNGKSQKEDDGGDDEPPKFYTHKPTKHTKSGAPFQHQEMMEHELLTKEEETLYGRRVVRARELRLKIEELVEERRLEREVRRMEMEELALEGGAADEDTVLEKGLDYDFLSYELEYLSMYGFRPPQEELEGNLDPGDDLMIDHAQHRTQHMSQLHDDDDAVSFVGVNDGRKRDGYRNGSTSRRRSSTGSAARNSYTSLLNVPIDELTEFDVAMRLDVPGGKAELVDVLLEGAYAREVLMRRNVKLVMSIAKSWTRNSFSTANSNGAFLGSSGEGGGLGEKKDRNPDRSVRRHLSRMYEGSWDKPSLDETVQEGMLGLARAVDKYDPERGLRFGTYATHWITSYVRVCFQRAATGCLRVPSQLHDIKAGYNRRVRDAIAAGVDPPGMDAVAEEMGISERRLKTALRATGTLLSVDAPVISGAGNRKGSTAGGDAAGGRELLISDTLKCTEPKPEDQVEISFLRQCLENAMAAELTPYERDVLRLRLGLDSGSGRTIREIAELSGGSATMAEVRSAERRAFKKLRSPASVHAHNLLAYLDLAGIDMNGALRR